MIVKTIKLHGKEIKTFLCPFLNPVLYVGLVVKASQQPLYCREIATVSSLIGGWLDITVCPEGREEKIF
jgi:hypothetical protein